MHPRTPAWILIPVLLLAVATGVATAIFSRRPGLLQAPALPFGEPAAAAEPAPAVAPHARARYRVTYRPCRRTEETEVPVPGALVGMTAADLARYYAHWRVAAFAPDLLVLERETDALCPELAEWRHLRLLDGYLTVFYGRGEDGGPVKERTGIHAGMLPPADRARLYRGVDLWGDDAVRAYLDREP